MPCGSCGAQGAAHEGAFDPSDRQALLGKERVSRVQIGLGKDLEAQHIDRRRIGLAQDHAMMAAFFQRAQIDRLGVLMGHLQAEQVDIEGAAGGQILDGKFDMAETDRR